MTLKAPVVNANVQTSLCSGVKFLSMLIEMCFHYEELTSGVDPSLNSAVALLQSVESVPCVNNQYSYRDLSGVPVRRPQIQHPARLLET